MVPKKFASLFAFGFPVMYVCDDTAVMDADPGKEALMLGQINFSVFKAMGAVVAEIASRTGRPRNEIVSASILALADADDEQREQYFQRARRMQAEWELDRLADQFEDGEQEQSFQGGSTPPPPEDSTGGSCK